MAYVMMNEISYIGRYDECGDRVGSAMFYDFDETSVSPCAHAFSSTVPHNL